ncbi:MAG: DedA family protein [Proteobacteria bacterium]|nr:DedA family protein [Pseudomonadota bacterium]
MEYFSNLGFAGLFLSSFLAATILPFSSEIVLGVLLLNGFNPVASVGVATFGNVLGSFVNYAMGLWGGRFLIRKVASISADEFAAATRRFRKYGILSLLFAWVPIIGDPLTVAAGVLKVNFFLFFILVASGKLIRYAVISYAILALGRTM